VGGLRVKLTFSVGSDAGFSVEDGGDGLDLTFLNALHVLYGEVSEGRVLGAGEHLVVGELPCLSAGHGKDLLEMVLDDH